MEALKQRIQRDGKIRGNNEVLKVDSFLNHQMDVAFLEEIGIPPAVRRMSGGPDSHH